MVLAAAFAAATIAAAQVRLAAPVRVKAARGKLVEFDGTVVRADAAVIVVRGRSDPRVIRTFSYSPKLRAKIEKMLEGARGYQFGDPVRIRYRSGEDVALGIRGKPSKPR